MDMADKISREFLSVEKKQEIQTFTLYLSLGKNFI